MEELSNILKRDECKLLIKHFPVGTYEVDYKNVKVRNPNDIILRYTGYTKEEFESMTPFDILTDNSKKLFAKRLELINKGESVSDSAEFEIITKNGEKIWVLITPSYKYEDGNIVGAFCIVTNITTQKIAELQVKEAKEKAQMYLDIAHNIFVALDSDCKITLINRAGCDILGVEECFLVGKDFCEEYIPFENKCQAMDLFNNILNGKYADGEVDYEMPIRNYKNEKKIIKWRSKVVRDINEDIIGIFSSGEDITEQKELEEKMIILWDKEEKVINANLNRPRLIQSLRKQKVDVILDKAIYLVANGSKEIK